VRVIGPGNSHCAPTGAFKSAKTVLDVQDKDGGRLVAKPSLAYSPKVFVGSARIKCALR
jgi:hypothetical protein